MRRSPFRGAGWGVLTWEPVGGRLIIEQVYDHQANIAQGAEPLLVIDTWEHAYYLQYRNDRAQYVDTIWNVINWADVADRFAHMCHGHCRRCFATTDSSKSSERC